MILNFTNFLDSPLMSLYQRLLLTQSCQGMLDFKCKADKRSSLENDTHPTEVLLLVDEKLHWVTLEGREAIRDESGVRESHLQRRRCLL